MKEVFKYTFLTIADIKKFLLVVLIMSILTLIEPFPFLGITSNLFEKLLFLSIGSFLIHLINKDNFFEELKNTNFSKFLFNFIPTAIGILLGLIVILSFWLSFFILILEFTDSIYLLSNPIMLISNITKAPFITQVLIGFYLIYFFFFSYIFLGKLGASLEKNNFKESFLTVISSFIDLQFWVKTINLRYFLIFTIWSTITLILYSLTLFAFAFFIFPGILNNSFTPLISIPIINAIYVIIAYFTFFSSYFAKKSAN